MSSRTGRRVRYDGPGAGLRGPAPYSAEHRIGAGLERLTRAVALAGGLLLVGVMAMTVASVLGRYLLNAPIPGDYEITELACGIAVFAFFPHCHLKNANIVVEFFTGRIPQRGRTALDAVHSFAFTVVAAVVTWRLFVGGMHKLEDGETTLFLGIPLYWGYFPALAGAGLLTVVCVWVLRRHLRALGG